jgi:hypothetical protein
VDGFLLVTQALTRTYGGDIDIVERQFVCCTAETTVVVRSDNPDSEILLYADVGLPSPADQLRIYRAALEGNLVRRHETVTIGVHVESDRMVATAALTHREMADVEALEATARKVMEQLVVCVHGMRARFAFFSE